MREENLFVDYSNGVARFSGVETLYRKFLFKFPDDPTFAKLDTAMSVCDYAEAFRFAHTLKGIAGNLSLDVLYNSLVSFVDCLRGESDIPCAEAAWPRIKELHSQTLQAISKLM